MFGKETTCCGKTLLIVNFILSFSCMIALSTIILYLTFNTKLKSGVDNSTVDQWNDDSEIDRVCGFDKYPVAADNGIKHGKLRWLGALFRHGDRTPIWFLDNDPYKHYDWPEGHEMLTNIGRRRMYCYGVALRRRYKAYLESVETHNVIAFSSWYRRTIETNDLVLTGMFPPTLKNSWAPTLAVGKRWQAIGVGSAEFSRSWMLLDEAKCPKAEKIQQSTTPKVTAEQRDFMKTLAQLTNSTVASVDDVYHIYDTLWIEKQYFGDDFQEPSWVAQASDNTWQKMEEIVELSFSQFHDIPDFLRLRSGVFLDNLEKISKNVTNKALSLAPMVHTFSSHDTTITPIIQSLGLYNKPPSYGSGMVFEIRETDPGQYFIRLIYVDVFDNDRFIDLDLTSSSIFRDSCSKDTCDVKAFFQALSNHNYLIGLDSIEQECALEPKQVPNTTPQTNNFFPERTLAN